VAHEGKLIVWADYVCPFCWLAEVELSRGRLMEQIEQVERGAFELRPAGTPLPDPDAAWLREGWDSVIEPLARELGVTIRYPELTTRTRKAHEAAAYARSEGALEAMHEAIYRAYWEDGRDIGRIDVLVEIGATVGLDRGGLRVALDIDQWTARVLEDQARAERLEIHGVPAYALQRSAGAHGSGADEVRLGLQRYDELKAWVMIE
jgi:predicted DsbA family dithiol-disulfide isomerase